MSYKLEVYKSDKQKGEYYWRMRYGEEIIAASSDGFATGNEAADEARKVACCPVDTKPHLL